MEIELKYHVNDEETANLVFDSEDIKSITDEGSEESIVMRAVYFDTEDRRLSRELMTFRVRREGQKIIGTIKWNGKSESGMHVREEINIPISDESKLETPDIEIFSETPIYDDLKRVVGNRVLTKVIETDVIRRQARIDTGKSICELSYDSGKIFAGGKEGIISEMEIELYSGDREDMENLGQILSEKFGLTPETRSKFRQGLELMEENH